MKRLLTRLAYLPFYLFSLFPLRAMYIMADLVYLTLYYVIRYRITVVMDNLRSSFPEKGEEELRIIAKKFYRHFCDVWIENNKGLTITRRNMKKRIVIKNPELINRYTEQQRNVILYAGHLGNWEWFKILPVVFQQQIMTFYQPLSNPYFDRYMQINRSRFGVITLPSDRGYRKLTEMVSKKMLTITLVIGDQSPSWVPDLYRTQFLNRPTAFLEGVERMASRLGLAVVFPLITPKSRGHYEMEFIPVHDTPGKVLRGTITDKYAKLLEQAIRNTPWMWLWSHRRWKLEE